MPDRPRVGISRCLLGDQVRYDGGHKHEPSLVGDLSARVELIAVCPELEVGMGVPREPIRLAHAAGDRLRLAGVETGTDWTDRMEAWAAERIAALRALRLSGFVLKARSPSCGPRDVPVHVGDRSPGLFAAALIRALPALPIDDEERLREPSARAAFLERVAAYHRRPPLEPPGAG